MAGARYTASGAIAMTTSPGNTALTINGVTATLRRAWINELVFANEGTPADGVATYVAHRHSASGVGVALVPTRLDLADGESGMGVEESYVSTEPTYTATEELAEIVVNTRATYRWVAPPGGELVSPATNDVGIGLVSTHASLTTVYRGSAYWIE